MRVRGRKTAHQSGEAISNLPRSHLKSALSPSSPVRCSTGRSPGHSFQTCRRVSAPCLYDRGGGGGSFQGEEGGSTLHACMVIKRGSDAIHDSLTVNSCPPHLVQGRSQAGNGASSSPFRVPRVWARSSGGSTQGTSWHLWGQQGDAVQGRAVRKKGNWGTPTLPSAVSLPPSPPPPPHSWVGSARRSPCSCTASSRPPPGDWGTRPSSSCSP